MFYSKLILTKKSKFGDIWLAAHSGILKKLSKTQISAIDLLEAADDIENPTVPLALRLSGHLLLGVVRIFYFKVENLYNDSNEAFKSMEKKVNKKMHKSNHDLPPVHTRRISSMVIAVPDLEDDGFDVEDFEDVDLHHWGALLEATHSTSQQRNITMEEPQTEIAAQEEEQTTFPTPFLYEDEQAPGEKRRHKSITSSDEPSDKKSRLTDVRDVSPIETKRDRISDARQSLLGIPANTHDTPQPMPSEPMEPDLSMVFEPMEPDLSMRHGSLGGMGTPLGAMGTPVTERKTKKRKANKNRRDAQTEFNSRTLRSFRKNSSTLLLDAPPPHKRRMALWQIDDGHGAARNVKELFCRFRETSFAPAVQDLFSKISRNEKKRSKWATPAESIQEPEIPRLGHETDPHNGNISVNHGAYVRDNELEQSPELEPVELEFSPTQTFGQIGEEDGLANRLAGDKDAHEEMVMEEISDRLEDADATTFGDVLGPKTDKTGVARAFFQILSLGTKGRITVSQSTPYGEIIIRPGLQSDASANDE